MRTILLAVLCAVSAASSFGQYSPRRLTQRIAPQVRPQQPSADQSQPPPQDQSQQPPAGQGGQPNANANANARQAPYYPPQYQYATVAPTRPVDPAKAAAEKARNEEKQFEFFKRRAEEGSDHAQYELGLRYLTGKGVAPDEKQAREWLSKAAKNGNSQAAKKLTELGGEPEKAEPAPEAKAKVADPKPAEAK